MITKILWVVPLILLADKLSAQELYRYVDAEGVTILNSHIPAEYVNSGYEVLDSRGQLIQAVPPQKKTETAEPELVLEQSDTILLTSYSSVGEIEERRDRKIDSIEREIENIKSDRRVLGLQMDKEIAERDRILAMREQRELAAPIAEQLQELESRVAKMTDTAEKLDAQLAQRNQDVGSIKNEYAVKVERFIQLEQADVDVRQTSLQNQE